MPQTKSNLRAICRVGVWGEGSRGLIHGRRLWIFAENLTSLVTAAGTQTVSQEGFCSAVWSGMVYMNQ